MNPSKEDNRAPGDTLAAIAPVTLVFDSHTYPDPVHRSRAWQAATSVSMETVFAPEDLERFAGSVQVCQIGPFLLADLSLSAGIVLRRRETRVRWEHDHVILDLILSGRMHGRIGAHPTALKKGDCVIVDLRGGMRLRAEDLRFVALIIPRPLFVAQAGTASAMDGRIFGAEMAEGKVLGTLLRSLAAETQHLAPSTARVLAQAVLNVLVACVTPHDIKHDTRGVARVPTLARLQRFIDQHAARCDFGPEVICASFGLSRAALYRTFAPTGGVAEAIRRRRAALAMRLLMQPDAAAAGVAQACGFGTERSLRNAMQKIYAVSPRDIMRNKCAILSEEILPSIAIENLFDNI